MSFNGSGSFLINTAGQPVVSGTVISSTAFNALTADLATGLSTCITKDGQTTVTANIPMANYKFTGLGAGSGAADSANLSQVQSTVVKLLASVSGTDTITAVGSPTVAAYAAGQMFYFVAAGDNTGAVTINIDSLGAKAVTRDGSVALVAGDIKSGEVVVIVYDGTRFQVVSQLNSSGDARFANVSIASALNVGGVATVTGGSVLNGGVVINEPGADADTRIEGDTDANLFFADASTDRIGIGTNAPDAPLHIAKSSATSGVVINAQNSTTGSLIQLACPGVANVRFGAPNADAFVWQTFGSGSYPEQMRLTSTGLGIGTSSPYARFQAYQSSSTLPTAWIYRGTQGSDTNLPTTFGYPYLQIGAVEYRASAIQTIGFGYVSANGNSPPAEIGFQTMSISGETYGDLVFATRSVTTNTAATERARITSGGDLLVGKTAINTATDGIELRASNLLVVTRASAVPVYINRRTNDGDLIEFVQDGTTEGSISVSGNTVSYNAFAGSHWSQLQDGSKPDILRGTVMESINELCVWPDETNERLPKAKISDTAGSKKVYGVFMAWDNDWTTTNDMYVTAVGAFICRVNGSVTVEEGDLLESNGDGTARVQADDIIRSSTIGKVTSTVKTHQYDDGSYCVPTVLYCG